jgi:hypothetical protein
MPDELIYDFDGENFIDRATGEIVPSEPMFPEQNPEDTE